MKKLIVANWKMNPETLLEAKKIAGSSGRNVPRGVDLVLCPPAVFFAPLALNSKGKKYKMGLQNIFFEAAGAYTGEISAKMAKGLGAEFIICGHSERRKLGETDSDVSKKVTAVLKEKMTPILCVGENERDSHGKYLHVLKEQIKNSLHGVAKGALTKIVIAYEPVWAIGKDGKNAMNPRILHETVILIRKILVDHFGSAGRKVKIIYGGSAAPENAREIVGKGEVDGLLVGHQSLKIEAFFKILQEVAKI